MRSAMSLGWRDQLHTPMSCPPIFICFLRRFRCAERVVGHCRRMFRRAEPTLAVILSAAKDLAQTFEARCFAALNMTVRGYLRLFRPHFGRVITQVPFFEP